MYFKENLILKIHNWRSFDSVVFSLPKESFIIADQNGSGKTSLISAFYSLFTGQVWPGTRLAQHLQVGRDYFGVSSQYPDWSFTGQVSPGGRVVLKYQKYSEAEFSSLVNKNTGQNQFLQPKVLTYLPTDNYWFSQGRVAKLGILDNLLVQVLGIEYQKPLETLDKLVKSKQKLIKHTQENDGNYDQVLLATLNESILEKSLQVWEKRQQFFDYLQLHLSQFQNQINSPLLDWQVRWEVANFLGQKEFFNLKLDKNTALNLLKQKKPDWLLLWQKEWLSGKVLFGAQRDDFRIESNHAGVEEVLSRGEMRLLVLFIKNLGRRYLQETNQNQPVFWLLDDVFNEFDTHREQVVINQILKTTDYFIVTSTGKLSADLPEYKLKDLTTPIISS